MKWKVTLPNGDVVDSTGSDPKDAACTAVKRHMPQPETVKDIEILVEVRRALKSATTFKEVTKVVVVPHFYWGADWDKTEAANR
jgi:hypothetical protein